MSDETLQQFIDRELRELYVVTARRMGLWCPRCDLEVMWVDPARCGICGMEPSVEGPPPRRQLTGILGAWR